MGEDTTTFNQQRLPEKWVVVRVDDVFTLENGFAFKSAEFRTDGIPVIKIKNVKAGYFSEHEFDYVSKEFPLRRPTKVARPDDLLISMSGNRHDGSPETWVGKVAFFSSSKPYMINQRVGALRAKDAAKVSSRFCAYLLSSLPYQELFISIATSSGGQANLSPAQIFSAELALPPLDEQTLIAGVLSALDDKIELNRQMNQTLEAMARAVFLDWFVDFGPTRRKAAGITDPASILGGLIPDSTKAAPLAALVPDSFGTNGLPLGWHPKTLGDVVEPRKGRNITKKTVSHGTVPVVAGGLSPAYYHDTPNVIGPVITASASGANAGFVRLYNQDIWASDCSYISREQTDYLFTVYALLSSRQDEIYSMQQGAAQPHIYPSDLKRLAITDAPSPVWEASETLLAPMFELLANNEQENQTLAATRDLLLPKLMSGELRLLQGEALA